MLGAYKDTKEYSSKSNSQAEHLLTLMQYVNGGKLPSLSDKAAAYAHAYLSGGAANYTDQNDIAVLKTGHHFDGKQASGLDKLFAIGGIAVPFVAGSLLKKMGADYSQLRAEVKTAEGTVVGEGSMNNGVLELDINTKLADGTKLASGRSVFNAIFETIEKNEGAGSIEAIQGLWVGGDNLATFNRLVSEDMSPADAARNTFTGKMAVEHGYTEVFFGRMPAGQVRAFFVKPKTK